MSIQALMIKGVDGDKTKLEELADGLLAFPRAMWLKYNVTYVKDSPSGIDKITKESSNNL